MPIRPILGLLAAALAVGQVVPVAQSPIDKMGSLNDGTVAASGGNLLSGFANPQPSQLGWLPANSSCN